MRSPIMLPRLNLFAIFMMLLLFSGSLFRTSNAKASTALSPSLTNHPVWRTLLLVYPSINVDYVELDGTPRHLTYTMSRHEILNGIQSFQQFPSIAHDYSNGEALVQFDIIYIDRPISSLSKLTDHEYWISPNDTKLELDQYAPAGKYDSVFVYWPRADLVNNQWIPSVGWGLGQGPFDISNNATYATVYSAPDYFWGEAGSQVWLHEWLHGVCDFYRNQGYPMPADDADGGGSHGYVDSPDTGWAVYYRDLMTGRVLDNGSYKGISADTWRNGSLLKQSEAIWVDYFYRDTTSDYISIGNVTWKGTPTKEQYLMLGNPQTEDNKIFRPMAVENNFTVIGRLYIPDEGIGIWDSVAVALRNVDVEYRAILFYGTELLERNSISITRNDSNENTYPLTLTPGWFTVKVYVDYDNGIMKMKAWSDGNSEPLDWQTSRSIDSNWKVTEIGFRHYGQGTKVDDLIIVEHQLDGESPCLTGQYQAEYYNNQALSESPAFTRCENSPINYDWGRGEPGNGVASDHFSARWTGLFSFAAGTYTFIARADDGIRVWVDGNPVIDAWVDQSVKEYRKPVSLSAGEHEVKVEYYENGYDAVAQVHWETGCALGQYFTEYYNNRTLGGSPAFTRCESAPISSDWGLGGPGSGVGADNFSVRWTGRFLSVGGNYTFTARADDGIRVWVDGNPVIDAWIDQAPTEYRKVVNLSAGEHEVKVEYYENGGGAVAQVRWETGCPTGQYFAEYYNNQTLIGIPTFTRCESTPISYDWGLGGPGNGVASDHFSVRWTGHFSSKAESYTFTARADDGIRVWVDGNAVINAWVDQAPTEYRKTVSLSAGDHEVKVEYYENGGGAVAQVQGIPGVSTLGQYQAEYYNNRMLSGSPTFARDESAPINYDWGSGGPGSGVGADDFSARWKGRFSFTSGTYTFIARADDGIRVWVDGNPVIDAWIDQPPTEYRKIVSLSTGEHEVKVEYYENGGGAVAQVRWETGCPMGQYFAEYYNNQTLGGSPTFTRCESAPISYDWGGGGPGSEVASDHFSVRWTGRLSFAGGSYTFIARADDGIRAWVDGNPVIDAWVDQAPTEYQKSVNLSAGEHEVKVEYYENGGGAVAQIR